MPPAASRAPRSRLRSTAVLMLAALVFLPAADGDAQAPDPAVATAPLSRALTFHAPFDRSADAAFAAGDPRIHHAPSREARHQSTPGLPSGDALSIEPEAGRYGGALRIRLGNSPIVFYNGARNVSYRTDDWSGTVSVWLSLDPDRDLAPGYSDPLLITPRAWDDASLFIDFTRDDVPRRFRFAAFADREVWNPSKRPWESVPVAERPMIEVMGRRFAAGRWTHVAWTWERFNTGADGVLTAYLDGETVGTLTGRRQRYSWDPDDVLVAIGIDYRGLMDDLAMFDRALSPGEVQALGRLPGGAATLRAGGR